MDFSEYFSPVKGKLISESDYPDQNMIGFNLYGIADIDGSEAKKVDLALIGVPEDRSAVGNTGCAASPAEIRKSLYKLQDHHRIRMADLGDLMPGYTVSDTYTALSQVTYELLSRHIIPIIIGGGNDLAFANFLAYEKLGVVVNMVSVDSEFNIGRGEEEINSKNYLSKILLKQPNYLFNFSNLGYQSYLVGRDEVDLIEKLNYDCIRLGMARSDITNAEPVLRNADMVSVDISSVRRPDAPGNYHASPNGFYGEEICQLCRYAGMSDKVTSIGFYECNTKLDTGRQSADLVAQMIWYFIDGFYSRKGDFPKCSKSEYFKYNVSIDHPEQSMVFYKSPKSGRWWMEIPYPSDDRMKYDRHLLAPCTYDDYKMAMRNEIPDRWLHMYRKLL